MTFTTGLCCRRRLMPALDGDMNWRRPLWESFYPRIRKESSLEAAAEIVVRHLRERVSIQASGKSPDSIDTIWQRQITNENGFEVIYIAALRSAGIPARKSTSGQAEFWNGAHWKTAPRPRVNVVIGDHRLSRNLRSQPSPADGRGNLTLIAGGGRI